MNEAEAAVPEHTIHWPEPAHLRLETGDSGSEPCEIEFNDGTMECGELLRFTGREEHLVFRPHRDHPRYPSKIVVRNTDFKRLRLTTPVGARPIDVEMLGDVEATLSSSQVHVYNVEFADQEIESGDTSGFVRNDIGLFLYFSRPDDKLERVFVPEAAIAYFQAGDPIGRVLVGANAVSEEQLQAAVDKQREMRKLVLGDYLIDEGLITDAQLDDALALQRIKPGLRLGEALIERGAIAPEALQIALSRQRANRGRPLGQILIDMGVVDEDTLNKIHAKMMGHHFVSLANFTASEEAIRTIPADVSRRLRIVPLSIEHGELIVAAESQLDSSALSELRLLARMRVIQVLASGQEIRARREDGYGDALDDSLLLDTSTIQSEGVGGSAAPADHANEQGYDEPTSGLTDPHLLYAIERALKAVESGGTLDIRIESAAGRRKTRILLTRAV